jgi:hypothetical protein
VDNADDGRATREEERRPTAGISCRPYGPGPVISRAAAARALLARAIAAREKAGVVDGCLRGEDRGAGHRFSEHPD